MPTWIERLQRGDRIRLVKEEETAVVNSYISGRLYITRRVFSVRDRREIDMCQMWYVDRSGRGFSGSLLIAPVLQKMTIVGNELILEDV